MLAYPVQSYLLLRVQQIRFGFVPFGSLLKCITAKGIAELHKIVKVTARRCLFNLRILLSIRPRINLRLSNLRALIKTHIFVRKLSFKLLVVIRMLLRLASDSKPTMIFIERLF